MAPTDSRPSVVAVDPDLVWRTQLANAAAPHPVTEFTDFETALGDAGSSGPTAILLGPGIAGEALPRLAHLRDERPGLLVVLVVPALSVPLMQQAMKAGIYDVLGSDSGPELLSSAVQDVIRQVAEAPDRVAELAGSCEPARLTVVTGAKAGEGTTTVAANLAAVLAEDGQRTVVLVDGDPRFGDVALALGLPPPELGNGGGFDELAISRQATLDRLVDHPATGLLSLVPPRSTRPLDARAEEHVLEVISAVQAIAQDVVVDAPFRLVEVADLLTYADEVLMVSDLDTNSLKNTMVARQILSRAGANQRRVHLVVNRCDAPPRVADVERAVGVTVAGWLPDDEAVARSVADGIPLAVADASGPFGRAVRETAARVGLGDG